ncbi:YfiR family protein [Fulvivirgaceae bacterium BMA12]|uniref:YfiR family protein n=1 Tax=Agaribacillus aureus TaxID=3051825 RepID=A0ABT8L0P1_9BACT|nr:YfiR family protein [Fulvivirgaceae bacterium BMA12]
MDVMKYVMIIVVSLGLGVNANAQSEKYKAAFLYQISLMVKWPPNMESGDFVIGIIGKTPVKNELETFGKSRKFKGRPIVIKSFSGSEAIGKCNILFLANNSKSSIADLASRAGNQGTLIFSESPGLATKGSSINFLISGGKLKIELNASTLEDAGLRASAELKSLAIMVD